MDVARKVIILARECGLQLGLDDLEVSSLVPPDLAALPSAAQYMEQLPQVAVQLVLPGCLLNLLIAC
jgi:aspartokinase/homoserine dehydrogenase 1